jgi:hypothetical protein
MHTIGCLDFRILGCDKAQSADPINKEFFRFGMGGGGGSAGKAGLININKKRPLC